MNEQKDEESYMWAVLLVLFIPAIGFGRWLHNAGAGIFMYGILLVILCESDEWRRRQ